MTTLPKEILADIQNEAFEYLKGLYSPGFVEMRYCDPANIPNDWSRIRNAYVAAGIKYHTLQQENADLKRRLAESMELLTPLLEYGQSKEAGFPLGSSVTEGILARAKFYEKFYNALEQIANGVQPANEREAWSWIETARSIANAALTAQPEADKTAQDEK